MNKKNNYKANKAKSRAYKTDFTKEENARKRKFLNSDGFAIFTVLAAIPALYGIARAKNRVGGFNWKSRHRPNDFYNDFWKGFGRSGYYHGSKSRVYVPRYKIKTAKKNLGFDPEKLTKEEIKKRWRDLVKHHHPDHNPGKSHVEMAELNNSMTILRAAGITKGAMENNCKMITKVVSQLKKEASKTSSGEVLSTKQCLDKRTKRKIVSKRQQRKLFSMASQGEISKKKVMDMAQRTKRKVGNLSNLPEKISKKSSEAFILNRAVKFLS